MPRYFLEVAYRGDAHAGFQVQKNAVTIQGALNHSLELLLKHRVETTGSSRTDAGVHARQNFLHVDLEESLPKELRYRINAILPSSIVLKGIIPVSQEAHARFSAVARSYKYVLYTHKDPFLKDFGYFFPYKLDFEKMQKATILLMKYEDFSSFSKRNTQVKTFQCDIRCAVWECRQNEIIFTITSNRFLRGMVRGLVATILKVGRGKITLDEFEQILEQKQCGLADFSVPGRGLFLEKVHYPNGILNFSQ